MKTMLIPVDLTETTDNAINYAIEWCKEYDYSRIILLKTFYNSIFDNLVPASEYTNVNESYFPAYRKEEMERIHNESKRINSSLGTNVQVSIATSELPLLRSIIDLVQNETVELIVAGSDHLGSSSDSYISSQVISIAKASPVRVLIVPSISGFKPIKKILVPIDFDAIASLSRLERHEVKSQRWKEKEMMVLYVDPKERYLVKDEIFKRAESSLHEYLKDFKHEVYYSNNRNILSGIMSFMSDHEAELVIALPGKHSFLYSLTHKSISEALYRNVQKPVLILK